MAGKDRKKQLARQRYERQQQALAQAAAKARRAKIIGAGVAVAVVVVGGAAIVVYTGKDGESKADGPHCAYIPEGQPAGKVKSLGTPPKKPAYKGTVQATVKTDQGDVVMQLDAKAAPCTVNSFAYLAQKNFYDDSPCHRLTSGGLNVLQCGDPAGTGMGGPGYRFANENTANAKYTAGTLAMAHSSQPDSNGSQFFMVYKDSQLDPDYSVFGKITKGLDILEKIAKAGSTPAEDGKPKKKVTIQDVTIAPV
ncbi:peptidylprolyl isomerase [Actinomadura opuntiae]|uniref:peptidylprolyl isomerase n=1 Tax=Actinomadura sp. OS1-43 TaxID=604315 RepID=UPI00255AA4EE|nr:peptidylprolyl isomerase [Actinomadura sp. OS1-43]MDL4821373.1 peptidylprolyl isomerase [Actinomadura sp. OS1-43]